MKLKNMKNKIALKNIKAPRGLFLCFLKIKLH